MSAAADVIVVGGGVAGLAVARALAERQARVLLIERGPRLASEASGNNAAIFRPLEEQAESAALPRRSRELLAGWFGPELIDPSGLLLVAADPGSLRPLRAAARSAGVRHDELDCAQVRELAPSLRGGEAGHGLLLADGGVLDVPGLTAGLADQARSFGARLRTGCDVVALARVRDRIEGIVLADGTRLHAPCVVGAAGAWNGSLAAASGLELPLSPLRRHLLQLSAAGGAGRAEPVVWRVDDEVYFRRHGDGVLASPCDERLVPPGELASDPRAVDWLRAKLAGFAPELAGARVQRAWACLRTFAADRELVAGADPRVQGLYWFAGLGGRGMSVAPAAAEALAAVVLGGAAPRAIAACSPERLIT